MTVPFFLSAGIGADAALADPRLADRVIELAAAARIDLLLLGEPPAATRLPAFDPLVVASWLAPRAAGVGLVPLVPALESEPFHVARALSALDFLSGGRSGWLPTTAAFDPARYGPQFTLDAARRVPKALDFIAATRSLWDGWDADALIVDAASGIYLDPAKVRANDYQGEFFRVLGPLNAARPPQGHPLLVQSDADPLWRGARPDVLLTDLEAPATVAAEGGPRRAARVSRPAWTAALPAELERRFRAGVLEGLHLVLEDPLTELPAFARDVLPGLARLGLLGNPDRTGSLRARLGLPIPGARPS